MISSLPVTAGHDHAALALLPFALTAQSGEERTKPLTVAYQAEIDGQLRRVNVTLRPGAEQSLPTPADQLVFLALLQLALDTTPPAPRLVFQRQTVIELLGWSDGGRNFDRLRESLSRLRGMTITVNAALVARDGREYARSEEAAGLIDAYRLATRRGGESWVEWGLIVREAFRLGDFKRLDWDLVLQLGNPLTAQLYRLIDRVTLAGQTTWSTGWRPLAAALGMGTRYRWPAEFRAKLQPHLDALVAQGVLERVEYERGGRFVFHVRNYLRAELRRVLEQLGVYPDAARQLVAAYDELPIMVQCDCLQHGARPRPQSPGGYLVDAVREGYELRYPADEPEAFVALWGMLGAEERTLFHRAGLHVHGASDHLFNGQADPLAWELEFRATVRFLVCHGLDPEEVLRRPVRAG